MSEHHEVPTTAAAAGEAGDDETLANETLPDETLPDEKPGREDERASEAGDQARRIAELEDAWRRTAAELDNFRKRCAREVASSREQERRAVAGRWLPVLDNLERALVHASSDPDSVVEGVRAVLAQAVDVLADLGYPRRDDDGRAFDPAVHEAISTVSGEGLVPGTVAQVVRPGYGSDDKILRPAAVVVATRDS